MPLTPRSRWLRLALALLAVIASHASIARAALGATCARVASVDAVAGGTSDDVTPSGSRARAPHDAPTAPALASPCATSVAALPPLTGVPCASIAWEAAALPLGPEARPVSHALPPPFHPPRAI